MNIKATIMLVLFAAGSFSFVYGSKNKVVNLKTFHLHLETYFADFGVYPKELTTLSEQDKIKFGKESYFVQLSEMVSLIREGGYRVTYTTGNNQTNYTFQISRNDFCNQVSSFSDLPAPCN